MQPGHSGMPRGCHALSGASAITVRWTQKKSIKHQTEVTVTHLQLHVCCEGRKACPGPSSSAARTVTSVSGVGPVWWSSVLMKGCRGHLTIRSF